jgi:hypothetical protein
MNTSAIHPWGTYALEFFELTDFLDVKNPHWVGFPL